jgi:hypothetical protein
VPQQRDVRPDQVGREPIFAWEAKVYTLSRKIRRLSRVA